MLKITLDVFSGRHNPQWILAGDEARSILQTVANTPATIEHADPATLGLGYRGFIVDMMSDDLHRELRMPASFRIFPSGPSAVQLIDVIVRTTSAARFHPSLEDLRMDDLRSFLVQASRESALKVLSPRALDPTRLQHILDLIRRYLDWLRRGGCSHEEVLFDPTFWNGPAHVDLNNCYNFATNRRTDTFAQPGRASGHPSSTIDCDHVRAAAILDGAVQAPPCPPDDQAPRYL